MKNAIYVSLLFIFGCQYSNNELKDNYIERELDLIELIDTFSNPLVAESANSITKAEFHPMYMGEIIDSISLFYNSGGVGYRTYHFHRYRKPDINDLKIYVDTSQIIGSVERGKVIPPPPSGYIYRKNKLKLLNEFVRGESKSYPVFIKNISKDTLGVGYGKFIPLIIEAKDSLGNWKPIQEPYIYYCGTGLSNYYLPPNEIVINSCKLFEGNFKTVMRISFGLSNRIKSNEFEGEMNYKQFDESINKYY